jgi:SAM-dependent methyltransferase
MEQTSSLRQAFQAVYQEQLWGRGSGPGSSPANTIEYRAFVGVTDLGCGDWQFSHLIDWSQIEYLGLDIVPEIVAQNRSRFDEANLRFEEFTGVEKLPGGDLLLSKEVFQHLPNQTIAEYLGVIRKKYRFALLTNSIEPTGSVNVNISAGGYRPVRLWNAPFNAPGAVVFSYFPHSGKMFWKNATFLMLGTS